MEPLNLKDQFEAKQKEKYSRAAYPAQAPAVVRQGEKQKAAAVEKIFEGERVSAQKVIDRPALPQNREGLYRALTIALAVLAVGLLAYFFIFSDKKSAPDKSSEPAAAEVASWYAVKLTNGEEYYGRIKNTAEDPVRVEDVYYNYDQATGKKSESQDVLRLVKKGQETYGPSGTMDVVRSQVIYMEPLKSDSKVLKRILENEGK